MNAPPGPNNDHGQDERVETAGSDDEPSSSSSSSSSLAQQPPMRESVAACAYQVVESQDVLMQDTREHNESSSDSSSSSSSEAEQESCLHPAEPLDACSAASPSSQVSKASSSSEDDSEDERLCEGDSPEDLPPLVNAENAVAAACSETQHDSEDESLDERDSPQDPLPLVNAQDAASAACVAGGDMDVDGEEAGPDSMNMEPVGDALAEVLQQFEDSDIDRDLAKIAQVIDGSSPRKNGSSNGSGSSSSSDSDDQGDAKMACQDKEGVEGGAKQDLDIHGASLSTSDLAEQDKSEEPGPAKTPEKQVLKKARALRTPMKAPSHPARSSWQDDRPPSILALNNLCIHEANFLDPPSKL